MKKLITAGLILGTVTAHGQQLKGNKGNMALDSLRQEKNSVTLQRRLKGLENGSEKDLITVMSFYQKDQGKRDSIAYLILQRYPKGDFAFRQDEQTIVKEENAEEREKLLIKLKENFPGRDLDQSYYEVSSAYVKNRNLAKVQEYVNQIQNTSVKRNVRANEAKEIMVYDAAGADALLKPEVERLATAQAQGDVDGIYYAFSGLYGNILIKEGKYQDALKYVLETYEHYTRRDDQLTGNYGLVLSKNGRHQEALPVLKKLVDDGKANAEIKNAFTESYEQVNPGKKASGYLSALNTVLKAKIAAKVATMLINEPSPDFEVKDVHGNKVSLADFKGKTIVLDFWATWCGPCKASFPSMQQVVNKYKNNSDVKFLFIHTLETANDPFTDAKQYLSNNHYNFDLYMDLKNPKTKKNDAAAALGVKGIPAKFVIDGKGNIRFKVDGFHGSEDEAVTEISDMIDLTRKNS